MQIQHDYRQVYATILQDWLGTNNSSLNTIFPSVNYSNQKLPFINNSNIVPSNCYFTPQPPVACACMQVKVFLEGFYNAATNQMTTTLANSAAFPSSQP